MNQTHGAHQPQVTFIDHAAAPGGAELSIARYLAWVGREVDVNLILFTDGYLRKAAEVAGVRVIYPSEPLRGILAQRQWLRRQRRHFAPLIVANSLNSAIVIASLGKKASRLVYYLREDLSPEWLSFKRRLVTLRLVLPWFDAFIANSQWTASTIPSPLRRKPVHVCYPVCGVSETKGAPDASADGSLRLLSLSRLAEWKGIDVIVDAVKLASRETTVPLHLTLAGADLFDNSDYARRVSESASALDPPPNVPGHVDDVESLLRNHDVLLHASRRAEPFGQVVIQGLSNSLAVIATNAGGPAEVISSGQDGILVAPGSASSMAAAIVDMANDAARRKRIAAAGRIRSASFLDPAACAALEAVLLTELRAFRGSRQ